MSRCRWKEDDECFRDAVPFSSYCEEHQVRLDSGTMFEDRHCSETSEMDTEDLFTVDPVDIDGEADDADGKTE